MNIQEVGILLQEVGAPSQWMTYVIKELTFLQVSDSQTSQSLAACRHDHTLINNFLHHTTPLAA